MGAGAPRGRGAGPAGGRAAGTPAGVPVVADLDTWTPSTLDLLALTSALIAPAGFVREATGEADRAGALASLAALAGLPLVVATDGPQGSVAWCAGQVIRTSGFMVDVVDTTGAGDAFHAGFVAACVLDEDTSLETCLTFANATAALACRGGGARGSLPTLEEVRTLVAARRAAVLDS